MKKRILSGLLVAAMLLTLLPTAAFAVGDTNAEAPDTGEIQTILPQSNEDAEQPTVTAPSYEVSTTAELSNALTQIATSAEDDATIVLKEDVTLSNDATSGYISSFGAKGKHITVKSDEGEMKKLSFPSYGVLTGDCTFDNVNVTGSRLFCNGYRTIFTENGQIHLSQTLYGGGYKTTVDSTYVVIAASGYINPSSSSGLHDVIGGSYQGSVEGDTYLEITGDIKMQGGNHLNPGCMKGDGSSGDGRDVPDVYVGGNATLIYDNKNSTAASPAIEGTYGCEMKGDVTLDVRAGSVAGMNKRIIASILTVIMLMTMLPTAAFAADGESTETGNSTTPEAAIYLDQQHGADDNDGLSKTTAVKTIEKANELANEKNIKDICLSSFYQVTGTETWDLGGKTLHRYGLGGYMIELVGASASLTLSNIVIDGAECTVDATHAAETDSIIKAANGGTIILNSGAILQNNKAMQFGSGILANNGVNITMEDGAIIDF